MQEPKKPKGDPHAKYALACYFKTGNIYKNTYKKKQTFYSKFQGEQEPDSRTSFEKLLKLVGKFVEQNVLQSASIYLNVNFANRINEELGNDLLRLQTKFEKPFSLVDNPLICKITHEGKIIYYQEKQHVTSPLLGQIKPFIKHHEHIPPLSHYSSFTTEQAKEYCLHLLEFGISRAEAHTIWHYLNTKYEFRQTQKDVINLQEYQQTQTVQTLLTKYK